MPGRPQGRRQIPGWRRADPGGPCTAGAAARPRRGRKARPLRVKPPHPAHVRSPKSPRAPPRSGAPCPAPGVPPVLTALRGGATAEPPRRAAAAASASASRAHPALGRNGEGATCRPGGPRARNPDGHGDKDTGTGTHPLHQTRGSGRLTPPDHKDSVVSKIACFFLPKECCHPPTDVLSKGERNSQQ